MKFTIPLLLFLFSIFSCSPNHKQELQTHKNECFYNSNKISILNFGTFHFGYTPDANSVEFDENSLNNKKQAHQLARKITKFKPTIILLERSPKDNLELQAEYNSYLKNPYQKYNYPTEVELLAFEVGRLSNTKNIYGIDHQLDYNYNIGNDIDNTIDENWYDLYLKESDRFYSKFNLNQNGLTLIEKLKIMNKDVFLDYMITANADILTHVGTDNNFEGADEAAKYYQRNLRMYTEMNRLKIKQTDRVFILLGASHTAFFRDFISRSPKYKMVKTLEFLK